jgi:hypothetical protein
MSTLLATDCIGHFSNSPGQGFYYWPSMLLNYLGFAAFVAVGALFKSITTRFRFREVSEIAATPMGAIVGSTAYFIISNFGAWLDPQLGYERSLSGLARCYWMGVPFWRPTLVSDMVFAVGFVAIAVVLDGLLRRRTSIHGR